MEAISFNNLPQAVELIVQKLNRIEQSLKQTRECSETQEDCFLNIKQAADLLSLSVPTIYTLVSKSLIPVSKRGKRLYFSKSELMAWVKAGRKKTITEMAQEASSILVAKRKGGI